MTYTKHEKQLARLTVLTKKLQKILEKRESKIQELENLIIKQEETKMQGKLKENMIG